MQGEVARVAVAATAVAAVGTSAHRFPCSRMFPIVRIADPELLAGKTNLRSEIRLYASRRFRAHRRLLPGFERVFAAVENAVVDDACHRGAALGGARRGLRLLHPTEVLATSGSIHHYTRSCSLGGSACEGRGTKPSRTERDAHTTGFNGCKSKRTNFRQGEPQLKVPWRLGLRSATERVPRLFAVAIGLAAGHTSGLFERLTRNRGFVRLYPAMPEGWAAAGLTRGTRKVRAPRNSRCRVTPGGLSSASCEDGSGTVPQKGHRLVFGRVRSKGCGKSAPRSWQQGRHGKPHRVQDRIGAAHGPGSGSPPGLVA